MTTPEHADDHTEELSSVDSTGASAAADTAEQAPASDVEATPAPRRRRRRFALAAGIAAAMVLGGGAAAVASAHKTVEIDVDGQTTSISTFAGDVGNLLDAEGITLAQHDLVVPGVDDALTDGAEIVVRTAEQIEVTIDGEATQVWTVGDTAAQALSTIQASGRDAQISASRTSGRLALQLPLVADGPVIFKVDGDRRVVQIEGVADLATALLQAEISVDADDKVRVTAKPDGTPVVRVTRIAVEKNSRTESIDFETVERGTDDLYEGEERVAAAGSEGERTIVYIDRLVDGEVVSSRLVKSEVTTKPEDRVVEYGTAERPVVVAPAPAPAPAPDEDDDSGDSGGGSSVGGNVWAALAQCESGGNPATNTGNGYYGLYQFSLPTWQSVGGSGLPSEASAAEQTQRAQILQARAGWGQWPACAAKLGLL